MVFPKPALKCNASYLYFATIISPNYLPWGCDTGNRLNCARGCLHSAWSGMIYNFISLVFRLHVLIDKQSDKYNCMAVFFVQHVWLWRCVWFTKWGLLVSTHRMGTFCDLLCVKETCSVKYCCVDLFLTRFAHIGIISRVHNHLFSPQVSGMIPQTQVF